VHAITVVHTTGCHYCEDARDALGELARDHPLRVEYVAASSPSGARLVAAHRAGMFPLVLLDGEFFSAGRLPRAKLRQRLAADTRTGAARTADPRTADEESAR
jgi:hypothetical protein